MYVFINDFNYQDIKQLTFKLETRFINIQQDTLTFTDLIPVEQILKNFLSCFKVLEYGIYYRTTSKTPRLLI